MNLKKSFKFWNQINGESLSNQYKEGAEWGWNECKNEILSILNKNCELEAISHDGKKVYKIYGTVIDKIEKEI